MQRFNGTTQPEKGSWEAYLEWREKWQVDELKEDDDLFADLRDPSPGRDIEFL
jgi:hypothetical protein